jgi:PAS domain S-box-containing protein
MNVEELQRAQVLAQLGCWEWDLVRGELEFTEEMYRLVGLWPNTRRLEYRDFLKFVHPADRHQLNGRVRRALQGKPYRADYRLRLRDGRVRWIHAEGEVRFDEAGRPIRMLGTALDVTLERRSFDQLEGGDRLCRVLVENAHDVIFRFRVVPDQGFDYLSPAAGYYTGLSPEEIYADPGLFYARVHPDDLPRVFKAIADPERNSPYQIRVQARGGKWLWAEQVLVPIRDSEGKLLAIEGVSRDITARKEAEAEREAFLTRTQDEHRWLRSVLAQLPGAVRVFRIVDGKKVLTANAAAERLLGKDGNFEIEDPAGMLLGEEEIPNVRALRGETVGPTEYRVRRSDGSEVPILGSASPIRDDAGAAIGAVVLLEDLTRLKETERQREEWTSVVAHDLRQPLTLMRANADLLMRQLADESQRRRVGQIADATRRLGRMIEDLLDVSRMEANRLSLKKSPLIVARWAQEVLDRAARLLECGRIELRLEGAPEIAVFDADRLEQVLTNLLSNAAKYGTPGEPIEVNLSGTPGVLTISVRNRGEPIPRWELPHLFDRFHRMRRAKESRVPGMGLGLYISKGLVEAHGGRIFAESDPAGFNTFAFAIPTGVPAILAHEQRV